MILRRWDDLPAQMQTDEVRPYYEALSKRRAALVGKRIFDVIFSVLLLILLSPVFLILAVAIRVDSGGPVIFRQRRITQYGRPFLIYKFRTMVVNAQALGSAVTTKDDSRITRVGRVIRRCRLDEIPQLMNILKGDMSFVGTRPEVEKYVKEYSPTMLATLLLPAGVTSAASIAYKDEDRLLAQASDADKTYVEQILPEKMKYNLESLWDFSFWNDIKTIFQTVIAVLSFS